MTLPPDIAQDVLLNFVPASIINDIACFVFYDDHPINNNRIDVTICTKSGEVKEFYQKDLLTAVHLNSGSTPTEIRILRNAKADLFYLVHAGDEITILSRQENLRIHRKVNNVDKYDVEDAACRGHACLKVFRKDDAVPLVFDDNFEITDDIMPMFCGSAAEDSLPIITELSRKLTEAKYSVKCTENIYKELLNLRQRAAFSIYQNTNVNLDDSIFKSDSSNEVTAGLKIKTAPWIKTCNEKIIIVIEVVNQDCVPLEDIHTLIHGTNTQSVVYTTKLYYKVNSPPFWREKKALKLRPKCETAVVIVIDCKQINYVSRTEFNGVLCYKRSEVECLLPFDDVIISTMDTMGQEFDVLYNAKIDEPYTLLAILATTIHTELHIRHIRSDEGSAPSIADMLCTHLQMEEVPNSESIVIHRTSPYHTLNGVMVVTNKVCETSSKISYLISVYTRSPSQVLALIHYIYDAVPAKLIVTTPDIKLTAKLEKFSQYNEDTGPSQGADHKITDYLPSMLKRTAMVLEHLDNSMMKMNVSKNSIVQSKIGKEIDLFAGGVAGYTEFRNKMLEEAAKGVRSLCKDGQCSSDDESDVMIVD